VLWYPLIPPGLQHSPPGFDTLGLCSAPNEFCSWLTDTAHGRCSERTVEAPHFSVLIAASLANLGQMLLQLSDRGIERHQTRDARTAIGDASGLVVAALRNARRSVPVPLMTAKWLRQRHKRSAENTYSRAQISIVSNARPISGLLGASPSSPACCCGP
jgi:hypothetical protein